jgi:hypothetical protein
VGAAKATPEANRQALKEVEQENGAQFDPIDMGSQKSGTFPIHSFLLRTSDDLSERIFVNDIPRPNRHDFDAAASAGSIDDPTSSYGQTPGAFKFLFERFPTNRVLKDV